MGDIRQWPKPLPPECVGTYRPGRETNLSQLEPEEKVATWRRIREQRPALAALLADPGFRALREAFDGEVLIENEYEGEPCADASTRGTVTAATDSS